MSVRRIGVPDPLPIPLWAPGRVPGATGDGPADVPTITPYMVDGSGSRGVVIVCPGGGYAGLAPHEGEAVARWLNGVGISAVVLRYRVAPYRHPCPLMDVQRAIRMVRHQAAEWRIDPQKVGVLGFSAGGHLTATAGTHYDAGDADAADPIQRQGCRPDAIVPCYAVITLGEHRHNGSLVNLIGADAPEDLRQSLSAELQVTAETPPAFVWHTADDAGVPAMNSLMFAAALARNGVPYELHIYESGRHGLGLATGDPRVGPWTQACAAWLLGRGFGG